MVEHHPSVADLTADRQEPNRIVRIFVSLSLAHQVEKLEEMMAKIIGDACIPCSPVKRRLVQADSWMITVLIYDSC